MARKTVYLPDSLVERVLEQVPDVSWSEVLREGLLRRLAEADADADAEEVPSLSGPVNG